MEEAYLSWKESEDLRQFPWDWESDIRPIELTIERNLEARGLYAPPTLFCAHGLTEDRSCTCDSVTRDYPGNHQLLASSRVELAINNWGPSLFPLISEAEVTLKGLRNMPGDDEEEYRSDYYGVTGVADVITAVNLRNADDENLILEYLEESEAYQNRLQSIDTDEYEVIIEEE
jgi:hypothetical protein